MLGFWVSFNTTIYIHSEMSRDILYSFSCNNVTVKTIGKRETKTDHNIIIKRYMPM